jgi:hypothetical protein
MLRAGVAALAAVVLALGAAACGGGGKNGATGNTSAADAVHAAAKKTAAAGGAHVQLATTVAAGNQSLSLAGAGDFDAKQKVGSLHATLALAGVHTTLDEVSKGTAIYVRSPFLAAFLPAGKTWLTADIGSASSLLGASAGAALSADPSSVLDRLAGLADVREVGKAQVGGTDTTRYHGTVDASKLPGVAGSGSVPFDVWVGTDGYVHKLQLTANATSSGQSVKAAVTMTLSGYGKMVHVSVPPASATVDASKVSIPGLGG